MKNHLKTIHSNIINQFHKLCPRRFHLYFVGTPISGTHSLNRLFSTNYRSSHEPEFKSWWNILLSISEEIMTEEKLLNYARIRDKRLNLEVDSSNFNYYLINILLQEFKNSKLNLTIRDCHSWLSSAIKHCISQDYRINDSQRIDNLHFGIYKFDYEQEESFLKINRLPTLDSYLSYWSEHNLNVIRKVSTDRLLIIKTNKISSDCERIANFVGVPLETLNQTHYHLFKARSPKDILSDINQVFLNEKVNKHCSKLMNDFFPYIKR